MSDKKLSDIEQADALYKALQPHMSKFTKDEIKSAIAKEGYSDNVVKIVLDKISNNKVALKPLAKTDKEKILSELSSSIGTAKKKNSSQKPNIFSKIWVIIQKIYFFFEDIYYSIIEGISKLIPIDKLTDAIDEKIPSFLVFLVLIASILYLIFSGALAGNVKISELSVQVVDQLGNPLNDAEVIIQINDKNFVETTDVFGEAVFKDISGKDTAKLIVSKDKYITKVTEFDLSDSEAIQRIVLEIDTQKLLLENSSVEQRREIMFVNNNTLIVGKTLSVRFYCSNPSIIPDPKTANVTTGKVVVLMPANCGSLKVDVTSNDFASLTNYTIPADNKVVLTKTNTETGEFVVSVKSLSNQAISDAMVRIYAIDNPATAIDESSIQISSATTDIYGRHVFNLSQAGYLVSVDKAGYLTAPKSGPFNVVKNSTATAELKLFTISDLQNINCSNPIYSQFCVNGQIDCNNSLLQPYTTMQNGVCVVGNIKYIDVSLKDANSLALVTADISLYRKAIDSNVYTIESTRNDINHTVFYVLSNYSYRIIVSGTQEIGYIQPAPLDVTTLDSNQVIYLTYSSALNSGTIGVNTKKNGYNIANTSAYLYYGSGTFEDTLVSPEPCITDINGDCNFELVASGMEYYAYAISAIEGAEGTSGTQELDANDFLQLNVNLQNQPKMLNLKLNVSDYNIVFYDGAGEEVNDYVVSSTSSDLNKVYTFIGNETEVYANIMTNGYASYQTDAITLILGQTVYKTVTLPSSLSACPSATLEQLGGLYDETGAIPISNIDYINNTIDDTYLVKFKYTSCNGEKDLAKTHLSAGNYVLLDDDYLYLSGLSDSILASEDIEIIYGYSYHGDLDDWNSNYFSAYYSLDHTIPSGSSSSSFKWVDIDFTDLPADVVEFSAKVRFKNGISQTSNYKIHSRALVESDSEEFAFDPNPTSANLSSWTIKPNGYFYAPTDSYQLPFESDDYALSWVIDANSSGNAKILYLNNSYDYNVYFIYLKDSQSIDKNYYSYSENTNDNLLYNSYIFKDKYNNQQTANNLNAQSFNVQNVDSNIGYYFDVNSDIKPIGFFSSTGTPKIKTDIIDLAGLGINVLSYTQADFGVMITTSDATGSNSIFIGNNDINFEVRTQTGSPISGISIKYQLAGAVPVLLGTTGTDGKLIDQQLSLGSDLVNQDINFIFMFSSSYNLPNNEFIITKQILSGYSLLHTSGAYLTSSNPLQYNIAIVNRNGIKSYFGTDQNYIINKQSVLFPQLQDILFSDLDLESCVFDPEETNSLLESQNNLAKYLVDLNTLIFADADVNLDCMQLVGTINRNILFSNILKIGGSSSAPVYPLLDANGEVALYNISLEEEFPNEISPGSYVNTANNLEIEFIRSKATEVNLDFNLLLSDIPANDSLKINTVTAGVSTDFDGINTSQLSDQLESYSNIVLEKSEKLQFDFDFDLNNSGTDDDGNLVLYLNISILETPDLGGLGGPSAQIVSTFIYPLVIPVTIYNPEDTYLITPPQFNPSIACSYSACSTDGLFTIENKTNSYSIVLSNITDTNYSTIPLEVNSRNPSGSFTIAPNDTNNLLIDFISDYNSLPQGLYGSNYKLELEFDLNVLGIVMSEKDINISFTVMKLAQPIDEILSDLGLSGDLCLASGGYMTGDDFYILSDCEEQATYNDCRTGEDALPKVFYGWDQSSTSGIDWSSACASDLPDYNTDGKAYCDSLQMLISAFTRLNDNNSDAFYVYLLADGVSEDLLKDFIYYSDQSFSAINVNLGLNNIFSDYNVDNNSFSISKNSNLPGLYKVEINPDFTTSEPSPLHISLTLVSELPYNERNIFYYLPVDGDLGYYSGADGNRSGYGANVNYLNSEAQDIIAVTDNVNLRSSNNSLLQTPVIVNADYYNNVNTYDFEQLQSQSGKLMTLTLDDIGDSGIALDLRFMPNNPVPIYSRAVCPIDNNLSYALKTIDGTVIPLNFQTFLTWNDYNDSEKSDLKDSRMTDNVGGYSNHKLNLTSYITSDKALIKSWIYLPASLTPGNYKLDASTAYNNDANTVIYTLSTVPAGASVPVLGSHMTSDIHSIDKIFSMVGTGKACIYTGLTSAYVKWVDSEVDFTSDENQQIINDYNNFNAVCN